MLKIFDKNHSPIGYIYKYKDLKRESELSTAEKMLSFTYLAHTHNIDYEYYVQDRTDEYVVKSIQESTDGFPIYTAVLNQEELEAKTWETFLAKDATPEEAANLALTGTGWRVAASNITKRRSMGLTNVSSKVVLQKICVVFMCEMILDSRNKTVSFYEQIGQDRGVYFMRGLNLKRAMLSGDTYDYYTRIIPIGKDGLKITDVNDGKDYLENFQYSRKTLTYIWEDTSYEDAAALKEDAEKKLDDMSKPKKSYTAYVRDLAKQSLDYSILEYGLGDTITLIDRQAGIRDKQRITKLVEYLQDPDSNTCDIANTRPTFDELQSKMREATSIIQAATNLDGSINGGAIDKVTIDQILHFNEGVENGIQNSGIISNALTELNLVKANIGKLEATTLKTTEADIKYATIENLNVQTQKVHDLEGDYGIFKTLTADEFAAKTAQIEQVSGELASYKNVVAGQLKTFDADITNLKAKDAELETALIGTAKVTDLEAIRTRTQNLEADVADINTLVNGNLTSDNIHSLVLTGDKVTVENGFIKSAMIESLAADKITGLDINTTKLTVHSEDGKSTWIDNTIQIKDANRVRVQIGKDASGDYTLAVWDKTGKLIWDALGATENTIQRKIIRDSVVADDAAIQGSKLDIPSVIREVNGAQTKISSTAINVDEAGQTLTAYLNVMETTIGDNLDAAKLYADGQMSSAQQYALNQANSALASAKTYAEGQASTALNSAKGYTDAAVDGLEIGGRNLIRNAKTLDFDNYYFGDFVSTGGHYMLDENGNTLLDESGNILLIPEEIEELTDESGNILADELAGDILIT